MRFESCEHALRVNVKQNAKGELYWDVTVRGDSEDEVAGRLDAAVRVAKKKVAEQRGLV